MTPLNTLYKLAAEATAEYKSQYDWLFAMQRFRSAADPTTIRALIESHRALVEALLDVLSIPRPRDDLGVMDTARTTLDRARALEVDK